MALHITTQNFAEQVEQSKQTVLVDFWAEWCGPCRMLAPVIEELEAELPDVRIGKVNVDEEPELARRFGVMSIPTVIVFKNGAEERRSVGLVPKQSLKDLL